MVREDIKKIELMWEGFTKSVAERGIALDSAFEEVFTHPRYDVVVMCSLVYTDKVKAETALKVFGHTARLQIGSPFSYHFKYDPPAWASILFYQEPPLTPVRKEMLN